MSKWREIVTYGNCGNMIDGKAKDHCKHFMAGGPEGSPEAFFCHGCGCHVCFHWKHVEKVGYEFMIGHIITPDFRAQQK